MEDCREVLLAFKKSMADAKAKKEAEAKKSVVSLSDRLCHIYIILLLLCSPKQ